MTPARNYLSIGEVLALLLEEFPDVTISKIRFLESQGLIEPERTASGYRKFSQPEVDRLKFILREQRENYLPLKVIRNRLDGDTSDGMIRNDEITAPRGIGHIPAPRGNSHPAGIGGTRQTKSPTISLVKPAIIAAASTPSSYNRREIIKAASINEKTLAELERYSILVPRRVGETDLYDEIDLQILIVCAKFISLGIDARHLKAWQLAANKEVSLFETRVVPLMRQRNPAARQEALGMFDELINQGGQLRAALIAAQARDHIEPR
ncbi:MAG: MerR family transcriptional regulator [Actinomycetota bacterium]|nr:MerR family transcriptional regulator [Actinomycetota bacterium]